MVTNGNGTRPKGRNGRAPQRKMRTLPMQVNTRNNGQARTPLLPVGVNNKATMPKSSQEYMLTGEEVARIINVNAGSTAGQIIYNELITPLTARRLGILSNAWQRIDWKQVSLHLVALNGSLVQSGYTMGFIEDPELAIPTASSEIIPFLTALRATTVRQNWVESTSGVQVATNDKPEMYTQPGSDIRRYSPGRLVIAVAGDVTTPATFQLMLRYSVRLYVNLALPLASVNNPFNRVTGSYPVSTNVSVTNTQILSYPGLPANVGNGATVTTTAPIVGIIGPASSPPSNWVLFDTGTSISLTITSGSIITFTTGGSTFTLARIDDAAGQFRAFNALLAPTTASPPTLYRAFAYAIT